MILVDAEGNRIQASVLNRTLLNQFMETPVKGRVYFFANFENRDTPIVVVLNLTRVGFVKDGQPQICSSFTATRVLFNPPLPDVDDFIEIAKEKASPVMTCLTQPIPTQSGQPSVDSILRNNRRIDIAELKNQRTDEPFMISCVVMKLETRHGWTYDGCSKCSSKPKLEDANVYGLTCKKILEALEPKYDDDKLAVQLFNNNAAKMKVTLEKLDELVGKIMILKLKLNDYNKRYPSSSISALQYTNDVANDNNTTEVNVNEDVEDGVEYNEDEGHREAENVVPSELPIRQTMWKKIVVLLNRTLKEVKQTLMGT
ncbi:uncharacterized protein LOC114717495 [Neltuma alba]|uniref:uncharacterized protein LOC114717495 n=1 Tax=Neltuma alba TaxID=207710 RepID=UPI0010A4A856|nr:uncharacterized protein LOC114717495 [Prosopis alba]